MAAAQGHGEAQTNLALMHQNGTGVKKDTGMAIYWYEKAAAQGKGLALLNLGEMYHAGDGVKKDSSKALSYWREAAGGGLAMAMTALGQYYAGEIEPPDYATARLWYIKASSAGDFRSDALLGELYFLGHGSVVDYPRALAHFRKAADKGMGFAMQYIGTHYDDGKGVEVDPVEAYAWYTLSAERGEAMAHADMIRLRKTMTSAQIAAAIKRASDIRAQLPLEGLEFVPDAQPQGGEVRKSTRLLFVSLGIYLVGLILNRLIIEKASRLLPAETKGKLTDALAGTRVYTTVSYVLVLAGYAYMATNHNLVLACTFFIGGAVLIQTSVEWVTIKRMHHFLMPEGYLKMTLVAKAIYYIGLAVLVGAFVGASYL